MKSVEFVRLNGAVLCTKGDFVDRVEKSSLCPVKLYVSTSLMKSSQ